MKSREWARNELDRLTARSKTPGLQYLAVGPAGVVIEHAAGWADIRRRIPMTPATTMMAYSMSKTITAAAVLRLVGEGKLGLDDPAEGYLPALPYGPAVTIRRLLAHTAGVPNPIPLRWVHPAAGHRGFEERPALVAALEAHPRLRSSPGKRYRYSNLGYWILGAVVEKAAGQRFDAFVESSILAPLGVGADQLGYEIPDPASHATAYLEKYSTMNVLKRFLIDDAYIGGYDGRWLRIRPHYPNGPAFGGLVGTAGGFGRFLLDQLASRSRILPDEIRALFYEPQRTLEGAEVPMTLGWHIGELEGERCFFKEGGGGGFHSMMRLYPDRGLGSVILSNATGFQVSRTLDRLDRELFRGPPAEAGSSRAADR